MGSCVSVNKDPESAMKLRLPFGSKTDNLVSPSPIKDKPMVNGNPTIAQVGLGSPARSPSKFPDFGSKEETFFDSRPWIDSDCEDDFFSVNGDLTPSRGSTPVHQSTMGTLKVKDIFEGRIPGFKAELSPTDKKKNLAELFKESLQSDQDGDELNTQSKQDGTDGKVESKVQTLDLPPKSMNGTPHVSGANSVCSSERTANADLKLEEKSTRSAQCCLPKLLSSRSFSERKKKRSPAHSSG